MAVNRKYADLPDLDSAPDIYETPDLTDDNSTVPTTTVQSLSDDEFDDKDDDAPGISRSRLRIDEARSRFLPAQLDARDVDFSDRLNEQRRSYRASSRRYKVLEDGTREIGDASDDEEAESLGVKIARLQREVLQAKDEFSRQKMESNGDPTDQNEELVSLGRTLDEMTAPPEKRVVFSNRPTTTEGDIAKPPPEPSSRSVETATYTVTYAPTYEQSHALAKAADFDRRLVLLEKAIGVTSSAMPELENNGLPRAILPALETLQNQVLTLSEASTSSLDSISRRVRALTQEAEQLEKSRKAAKAAQENLGSTGGSSVEADDSGHVTKINALYGTLPTIESLAPVLPPLLDRLRSLRVIHTDAATAANTLERIEKAQGEMASDINQWREGLVKIEAILSEENTASDRNLKVVEGWVKDLEAKMSRLS